MVPRCILINERNALIDAIREQECYVERYTAGLRIFVERYNEVLHQLEQLEKEDEVLNPGYPYRQCDPEHFDESEYLLPEGYDPAYIYDWSNYSDDDDEVDEDGDDSDGDDEEYVNNHLQERMCVRRDCDQFGFCREHELNAVCVCSGGQ